MNAINQEISTKQRNLLWKPETIVLGDHLVKLMLPQ